MSEKIITTRRYKAGYEIRTAEISGPEAGGGPPFIMKTAYTPEGHYIGMSQWAHRLIVRRGIKPEVVGSNKVCSIGFCEKEQKWYGWSHRAMYGFGTGDEVKEGDLTATSGYIDEYLKLHPERDMRLPVGFKAQSLADAKTMAVAFAEAVG